MMSSKGREKGKILGKLELFGNKVESIAYLNSGYILVQGRQDHIELAKAEQMILVYDSKGKWQQTYKQQKTKILEDGPKGSIFEDINYQKIYTSE